MCEGERDQDNLTPEPVRAKVYGLAPTAWPSSLESNICDCGGLGPK